MRFKKLLLVTLGVTVGLLLAFGFLMGLVPQRALASEVQSPAEPGVAISPGVVGLVNAGDIVTYYHTITNTGDSVGSYSIQAQASEGWPLEYFNVQYPAGTTVLLPFPLQAGEVATIGVRLTVPTAVQSGVVNTTSVTATVMSTMAPHAHAVAYNRATVSYQIYLPLVFKN